MEEEKERPQIVKKKIPLADAANSLAVLCNYIDEGQDLSEKFVEIFHERKLEHKEAIDRRIAFIQVLGREGTHEKPGSGLIGAAQEAYRAWKAKFSQLQKILDTIKGDTMAIMDAFPDLPYQGDFGKLAIQKNPPSLKIDIPVQSREFSNVISEEEVEFFGIERRFVKVIQCYVVDTEAVKTAMKQGENVSWCHVEQGKHLRVRL